MEPRSQLEKLVLEKKVEKVKLKAEKKKLHLRPQQKRHQQSQKLQLSHRLD